MNIFLITSKLAFETNGSPIGGSVVDLHLKAKGLQELGHDVTVVTAFSESDKIPCKLPYTFFERRIKSRGLIGLQIGVYSILREFSDKADLFYIDGHMFLYGGGAYRLFGGRKPVIGFFNVRLNAWADASGNLAQPSLFLRIKKSLRRGIERVLGAPIANHLDAFIFNTPHVQRMYHAFGIAKKKPNTIIEDFVATKELSYRFGITSSIVAAHHTGGAPVTFLATGRMIQEKGFDLIIRAFAGLPDAHKYRLIISGGGPDKERLEHMVNDLGLQAHVTFPGWVEKEKLYGFFKEAHVFVFPKWWIEYGSAVLTETMAFGLPSIIPGGGALEWLTGGSALTFKNDDVEELRQRMATLGENVSLRTELAEKTLRRSEALNAEVLAKKLEKVLVSTL